MIQYIKTTIRDFINENYIKDKYFDKGSYKRVFNVKNNPDKLIKCGKGVIEEGELFLKFPDFSPKVYHIDYENEYIVVEKLDVNKSIVNFDRLINKDRGYIHDWGYITFKNDKKFDYLLSKITTDEGRSMLYRIRDIVLNLKMTDIHSRNFGYDKNDILKAIDI